jgi:drug/metabolite transporter (DMT)-like permease
MGATGVVPSAWPIMTSTHGIGILAALGAAVLYGVNVPYARLSADLGLPGADLVAWRVLVMLAVVVLAAVLMRRSLAVPRAEWGRLALLAVITAAVALAYLSAIAFIPVGLAVIVFFTFPCVILIVSPLVDGERITLARLAAFLLSFSGLVLAIGPAIGTLDWRGVALALLASLAAAGQFLLASRVGQRVGPVPLVFWVHVGIGPVALAVAMAAGGPAGPAVLWLAFLPFVVNSACYVAGFFLHMRAVAWAPPALIGLIYTLEPVVTIGAAALLLGERLAQPQYVGGALVISALLVAVAVETRPKATA